MDESHLLHPDQERLAEIFSSITLLGPPMSHKLRRLVAHLFTPAEAGAACSVPFYYPRPLEAIARRAGRPARELAPLLETMADKRVIYGGAKGYSLMPLIPGMFEYMLMDGRDSDWHREYARLINDLYATGYTKDYNRTSLPAVRNLPVQTAVDNRSQVAGPDLVAEMIDRHEHLAVINVCQCRQSLHFIGRECQRAKPADGCLVFGSLARDPEANGNGRAVSRQEMRELVAERREKKLVLLTANVAPDNPNVICTCCDCCCHFLESVNYFGGQTLLAPPQYRAALDPAKCNHCGRCVQACNTYAHTLTDKKHAYLPEKCIGCGACLTVCKPGALSLCANPDYRPPSKGFTGLSLKLLPAVALSGLHAKRSR